MVYKSYSSQRELDFHTFLVVTSDGEVLEAVLMVLVMVVMVQP